MAFGCRQAGRTALDAGVSPLSLAVQEPRVSESDGSGGCLVSQTIPVCTTLLGRLKILRGLNEHAARDSGV